jgi:hypothetical protein
LSARFILSRFILKLEQTSGLNPSKKEDNRMNNEFERIWKEVIVTIPEFAGETDENHEKPQSNQPVS